MVNKNRFGIVCMISAVALLTYSCKKDPPLSTNGFPLEVATIFETKCAISGCHNDKSYQNAAGLNLTSWDKLVYQGGVSGSVAIPFRPQNSSLFQFCNTYPDLGLIGNPTMPLNAKPLSRDEVLAVKNWIIGGCKNTDGEIPFQESYLKRTKLFIANQGCDVIAVADADTKLIMRYFDIGSDPNQVEVAHNITLSPDGRHLYICFIANNIVQKYSTLTNLKEGEVQLGVSGLWNVIKLSQDGSKAYVSDLSNDGKIAVVNTQAMTMNTVYQGSGLFSNPHGIAVKGNGDTLYITAQYGNFIYRFIPSLFKINTISLAKGEPISTAPNTYDPHEIIFSPDGSKYFVSCQSSNEVRVFDAQTDTLLKAIPVGKLPLEFALSKNRNLIFVSCSEEPNPNFNGLKGSVEVINMENLLKIRTLYGKFFQPHGLVVDEKRDQLWVVSRNNDPTGPAPHHTSECGGRNGFYEVIDIKTWQRLTGSDELSVDPYSILIAP